MLNHTRISRVNLLLTVLLTVLLAKFYRGILHLCFQVFSLLLPPHDKPPQIQGLRTTLAGELTVPQTRSPGMAQQALSAGPLQAKTKLSARLGSLLAALGPLGCRLISIPCVSRTEAPIPSLAVPGSSCSQLLEAVHVPCHRAPSIFKAGNTHQILLTVRLLTSFSDLQTQARLMQGQASWIISLS